MAQYYRRHLQIVWSFQTIFQLAVLILGQNAPSFSDFAFTIEPQNIVAVPGRPAILNCSAHYQGSAEPTIQWMRDGVYMNFGGETRRFKLANGSLSFTEVIHSRSNRPDEGVYQCVASVSDLGSIISKTAKLQVAYIERFFEKEPEDLTLREGDTAMFSCLIEGHPTPKIDWYKDDRPVDSSSYNILVHPDGVLEIRQISSSDFDDYKCEASVDMPNADEISSLQPKISSSAVLRKREGQQTVSSPEFVIRPVDTRIMVGLDVILYCAANGRDRQSREPQITWLKDGAPIDMANLDSRFSIVGQGSLKIENVEENDKGLYTCRADNLEDSVDADATLIVHIPPTIVTPPRSIYAHENGDVEFICDIYGFPKPLITWRKNGDVLVPNDYFQISEGHLRILGLVNSDDGLYQCIGENAWGSVQSSAQLVMLHENIPIPTLPTSNTTPNIRTGGADGTSTDIPSPPINLEVVYTSTRFVTLHWDPPSHQEFPLSLTYSIYCKERESERERVINTTNTETSIQYLKPATQYVFKVYAYNTRGRSQESAQIVVTTTVEADVPSPVVNPTAHSLSTSQIRVEWQPPSEPNGVITLYRVYYYEVGARTSEETISTTSLGYELSRLKTFKEYSFRVVAFNEKGAGASTEEFMAMTFSDMPSGIPQNVTLEVTGSSSIVMRWEPPTEDDQNGLITGYQIRYRVRHTGSRRANRFTTGGNARIFEITDLQKNTEYQVRIAAQNVNGTGPNTAWLIVRTFSNDLDESIVPGQPSSLRVRPLVNSIVVSWTPPHEQNIMIRGYTLNYGIGHPDVNEVNLEAKKRYHTITNLQPSAQYVISLKAYNSRGSGRPIMESVATREETVEEPETPMMPPVGLQAIVVSETSVALTWTDSSLGGKKLIRDNRYYTVRYKQQGARKYKFLNSSNLMIHIDDLRASTTYEFTVKVIKGRRQSTWSLSVDNKTFEAAPQTAPRDVTPVAREPTIIQLNWQPPRHPNGLITGYLIFYTTDNMLDVRDWVVEGSVGAKLSKMIRDLTPDTTYYFRMQARNRKGYGPMSSTVIFRTPRADGTGGGTIDTPNEGRLPPHPYDVDGNGEGPTDSETGNAGSNTGNPGGPMSSNTLWIIIACVAGVTLIVIITFVAVMCRRRYMNNAEKRQKRSGYKGSGKNKGGPKDMNPPDLWIHHENVELRSIEKPNHPDQTMTVAPMRRDSQEELKPLRDEDPQMEMDKRRNSFLKARPLFHRERTLADSAYSSHSSRDDDRYPRRFRSKPIMISVDTQPHREPIATATAIPNGHMPLTNESQQTRQPYPRMQYSSQYNTPPRVYTGECSVPSSEDPSDDSLERMGTIKRCPAHFGDPNRPQSPESSYESHKHSSSPAPSISGSEKNRPVHPLKSFSVPGPPPAQSAPNTPTPKHIVKPQPPPMSPYRKNSQSSGSSVKTKPPLPVVMPRAPDVTIRTKEQSEIQRATSTEELTAEMANLEGLMKDLNAITQSEFEC